ncbi:cysteinyl-tRNA synthetase [Methanosarcina thermophila]|jgi:cysteinyl-tRNA synthetase|uniref:Cysteine--tRNA ligase n=3 Tax=Methanosarcina thermophila TaxID=2210 RepID=A0A1I6XF02_METTE|nr:cysteine--tRNA ligase [Methanosarcina thermophila]AKB13135.1 Cysteinyl-tRNA synthetase [Methanosarcina thermophila TM-1]AKB16229.1 Cysteinyl-tRNA synthetase [Methanosarcina thermophila CHTI-55]NLU57098.1 cysteine--tRNA ligase [Methanosarcina thermophila]SFT36681.1 cysteinyl-tRNA synthetase [Methanosarcina thermophila]BAW28124.1 cysteinyl-tRNA synthetase [Methanosarcina thermophila]
MLKVYNTLTRRKDIFKPLKEGEVSIYACGPTVYSMPHIGNYRTFLMTDNIVRTLEYLGYKVKLVMNITDIDDKTIRDSKAAGMSLKEFTDKYTAEFFKGLNMLNIKRASAYPRATENVGSMIELTKKLMDKGLAYEKGGSVYYRISSFPDYGKLSKLDFDKIKVGASVDVDEYDKDNPRDFALLKASTPEEIERGIYYESPWGKIRPGWHIECSVMAMNCFGPTLDMHLGGVDLIFPHHENEIAQSEGATGKPFARYWIHVEHLIVEGEKMSKSKGNIFTLPEIVEKYGGEVVRFMFLTVHYRKKLDYSDAFAENAKNNYLKLKETLENLEFALANAEDKAYPEDDEVLKALPELESQFREALEDDFNTPKAITVFRELSRTANKYLESGKNRQVLNRLHSLYRQFSNVLGIFAESRKKEIPEEIMELVKERENARKRKDWAVSDAIREKIKSLGYIVQDTKEGPHVREAE